MKRLVIAALAVVVCASGCYTTKIQTTATPEGLYRTRGQWFTLGGLVPLSRPSGGECPKGLALAESKEGGVDILLALAMTGAGFLIGSGACAPLYDPADPGFFFSCQQFVTSALPFMLARRTVTYKCVHTPAAAMELPRPEDGVPPIDWARIVERSTIGLGTKD